MNRYIPFSAVSSAEQPSSPYAIQRPDPAFVLSNPEFAEKQVLLPVFSIQGEAIGSELAGLWFHFLVQPVYMDTVDFRLNAQNQYELLKLNGKAAEELTEEDLEEAATEMEEAFSETDDTREFLLPEESYQSEYSWNKGDFEIQILQPNWLQSK